MPRLEHNFDLNFLLFFAQAWLDLSPPHTFFSPAEKITAEKNLLNVLLASYRDTSTVHAKSSRLNGNFSLYSSWFIFLLQKRAKKSSFHTRFIFLLPQAQDKKKLFFRRWNKNHLSYFLWFFLILLFLPFFFKVSPLLFSVLFLLIETWVLSFFSVLKPQTQKSLVFWSKDFFSILYKGTGCKYCTKFYA